MHDVAYINVVRPAAGNLFALDECSVSFPLHHKTYLLPVFYYTIALMFRHLSVAASAALLLTATSAQSNTYANSHPSSYATASVSGGANVGFQSLGCAVW